jgi:DNA-binding CsgD family transcriptional regulator
MRRNHKSGFTQPLARRAKSEGKTAATLVRERWEANGASPAATARTAEELMVSVNTVNVHLRAAVGRRINEGLQLTPNEEREFVRLINQGYPMAVVSTQLNKPYYSLIRWAHRHGWRSSMTSVNGVRRWQWRKLSQ